MTAPPLRAKATSTRTFIPAFLLLCSAAASGAEIHLVPGDSIQAAIDDSATFEGDEIVLAPGTYVETINFHGRALTLRSQDPSDPVVVAATVLDGGGMNAVITCFSGEGRDTVVDGLTITGGTGGSGGGMVADFSGPTVRRCVFSGNSAFFDGGGLAVVLGDPLVSHCRFVGNDAQFGGGLSVFNGAAEVVNCAFSGNVALASGGGVDVFMGSGALFANCAFAGNDAGGRGGAMAFDSASPTVANSVLYGNRAGDGSDEVSAVFGAAPTFTHCLLAGSGGSAAWNPAFGVDLGGNLDGDPLYADADGADDAFGTIDDDLAPSPGSPVIDAGANDSVPADTSDLDGDGDFAEPVPFDLVGAARFLDDWEAPDGDAVAPPLVDMGPHERVAPPPPPNCLGDVDQDGFVGVNDLLAVIHAWGLLCEGCPEDVNATGRVDFHDLLDVLVNWGTCAQDGDDRNQRHGEPRREKRRTKPRWRNHR